MIRIWCVLFVFGLCIELSIPRKKDGVHFKNSLRPNNILKVHCISDEDDYGTHFLSVGQTLDYSFYESIFVTEIHCDLWQGPPNYKFHAVFTAYHGGGLIRHYGKQSYWDAREDGVYFTHGQEIPKLRYKWNIS